MRPAAEGSRNKRDALMAEERERDSEKKEGREPTTQTKQASQTTGGTIHYTLDCDEKGWSDVECWSYEQEFLSLREWPQHRVCHVQEIEFAYTANFIDDVYVCEDHDNF